jgi:hypothetical protein
VRIRFVRVSPRARERRVHGGLGMRTSWWDVGSVMVVLDVVDGEIRFVEVLHRGDLRPALVALRQRLQHGP